MEQASAFLHTIPRRTLQGSRNYSLFLAYLATGRRNAEIRHLRWCDFENKNGMTSDGNGKVFYRWSGKGKDRRDECPMLLWNAILGFLKSAGRLNTIQSEDYIFTALNDNASRLPT